MCINLYFEVYKQPLAFLRACVGVWGVCVYVCACFLCVCLLLIVLIRFVVARLSFFSRTGSGHLQSRIGERSGVPCVDARRPQAR